VRAEANTLCLSCHGSAQASVRVNTATGEVSLLGNQKMSLDEYRQAPKLGLDPSGTTGHPILGHPVTGKDPHGKELNCLSCHDPHSSAVSNLMPHGIEKGKDLCARCHPH
jgi:predicted CXXCH cytochrome family protein